VQNWPKTCSHVFCRSSIQPAGASDAFSSTSSSTSARYEHDLVAARPRCDLLVQESYLVASCLVELARSIQPICGSTLDTLQHSQCGAGGYSTKVQYTRQSCPVFHYACRITEHFPRMKERSYVRAATAAILRRAQLAALLFTTLGIVSKLLLSSGTLASPNATGLNSDEPSRDQVSRKAPPPAHSVQVQGFCMEEYGVTNAEFSKFVGATGYDRFRRATGKSLADSEKDRTDRILHLILNFQRQTSWQRSSA
jgi:sulfatase-modifying factor enzyme 1